MHCGHSDTQLPKDNRVSALQKATWLSVLYMKSYSFGCKLQSLESGDALELFQRVGTEIERISLNILIS